MTDKPHNFQINFEDGSKRTLGADQFFHNGNVVVFLENDRVVLRLMDDNIVSVDEFFFHPKVVERMVAPKETMFTDGKHS